MYKRKRIIRINHHSLICITLRVAVATFTLMHNFSFTIHLGMHAYMYMQQTIYMYFPYNAESNKFCVIWWNLYIHTYIHIRNCVLGCQTKNESHINCINEYPYNLMLVCRHTNTYTHSYRGKIVYRMDFFFLINDYERVRLEIKSF